MRKLITLGFTLSLLAIAAAAISASQNAPDPQIANGNKPIAGPTEQVFELNFNSPSDTFSFNVEKAQKAGNLTVETLDCCIPGDYWRADLTPAQPANGATSGLGDGNVVTWSGTATVSPWVRGTVKVSYDHGTGVFPAGMWVKFSYSQSSNNNTGINVTPLF